MLGDGALNGMLGGAFVGAPNDGALPKVVTPGAGAATPGKPPNGAGPFVDGKPELVDGIPNVGGPLGLVAGAPNVGAEADPNDVPKPPATGAGGGAPKLGAGLLCVTEAPTNGLLSASFDAPKEGPGPPDGAENEDAGAGWGAAADEFPNWKGAGPPFEGKLEPLPKPDIEDELPENEGALGAAAEPELLSFGAEEAEPNTNGACDDGAVPPEPPLAVVPPKGAGGVCSAFFVCSGKLEFEVKENELLEAALNPGSFEEPFCSVFGGFDDIGMDEEGNPADSLVSLF